MITIENTQGNLIRAKIAGKISKTDFISGVGPQIENIFAEDPEPKRLLMDATNFHGWDDFSAFSEHVKFAEKNQGHLRKIAVLGNKAWEVMFAFIANLLVKPKIRIFPPEEKDEAIAWLARD